MLIFGRYAYFEYHLQSSSVSVTRIPNGRNSSMKEEYLEEIIKLCPDISLEEFLEESPKKCFKEFLMDFLNKSQEQKLYETQKEFLEKFLEDFLSKYNNLGNSRTIL